MGATYSFKGTADFSQHNQEIEKAKGKITDYKDEVQKAQRETDKLSKPNFNGALQSQRKLQNTVKTTTNLMNGLSGNMMGAIAKFGPYAAAAVAGFKLIEATINKARSVNETFNDSIGELTSKLNGAFNEFANRLTRLDFSNLLSGLSQAAQYAGQLYNSLDKAGTYNLTSSPDIMEINNTITAYRIEVQKLENEVKKLKKEQGNKADTSKQLEQIKAYNQAIQDQIKRLEELYKIRIKNANQAAADAAAYMGINKQAVSDLYSHRGVSAQNMTAALGMMSGNRNGRVDAGRLMQFMYDDIESPMLNSLQKAFRKMLEAWESGNKTLADKIGKDAFGIDRLASSASDTMDALADWMNAVRSRMTENAQNGNLTTYINQRNAVQEAWAAILAARQQGVADQRSELKAMPTFTGGGGSTKTTPDWVAGSIGEIDAKIKELKDRLENEKFDLNAQIDITKQIEELNNQKAMLELQVAIGGNTNLTNAFGDLLDGVLKSGTVEDFSLNLVELIDKYLSSLPELQLPAVVFPSEEMEASAREAMANIDAIIEEEYQKILEETQQAMDDMATEFDSLGTIFTSLGSVMGEGAQNTMNVMGNILSSTGQVVSQLSALAAANGVASAAELPYPANLAAIASVVAAIFGVISQIQAIGKSKAFAGGGIFEGSGANIGDVHVARVNPGEMILNNRQQANLFRMLNEGVGPQASSGGHVEFHISGRELVGVLDNQNRSTKRVS